jgi:hypothetical protein
VDGDRRPGGWPYTAPGRAATALGIVLAVGWLAASVAVLVDAVGLGGGLGVGGAIAVGLLAAGFLAIAVVAATGVAAARAGRTRRLATAALCSVVVGGWQVAGMLSRGLNGFSVLDAGAVALFAAGTGILVALRR